MGTRVRAPGGGQHHAVWGKTLLLVALYVTASLAHAAAEETAPQPGGTTLVEVEGKAKVGDTTLVEVSAAVDAEKQHMYRTPDNHIILTEHSVWPPRPKHKVEEEEHAPTVDLIPNHGVLADKIFPRFRAVETAGAAATTAAAATATAATTDHASGTADPDVISKHTTRHKTPSGDIIETTTVVRKEVVMEEVSGTTNSGSSNGGGNSNSNGGGNSNSNGGGSNSNGGGGSSNNGGGGSSNQRPSPPPQSSSAAPAGPSQQDMRRMEEQRRQEAMRQESMRREMEMKRQEEMAKQQSQMRSMEQDPRTMSAGGRTPPQSQSSGNGGSSSVTQTKDDGATIVSRIRLRILQPDDGNGCCGKGDDDGGRKKKKDDGDDWKGKLPDYAKVHIRGPKGRVLTVKVGPYQPVGQLASLAGAGSESSDDDDGDEKDDAGPAIPGGLQGTAVPVMGIPYYQTGAAVMPAQQQKALAPMVSPQIINKKSPSSCGCWKKPACDCATTPITPSPGSSVRRLLLFEKAPQTARAIR